MLSEFDKPQFKIKGEKGLPENYPIPQGIPGLIFYIQRNLNKNTVIYTLNIDNNGFLNESYPMRVSWIKYTDGGIKTDLNFIQTKAFGYTSKKINNNAFEFVMDSYTRLRFFIGLNENNEYKIFTKINKKDAILSNIYVYANEFGLFPKVEYIELYGTDFETKWPTYQKILI